MTGMTLGHIADVCNGTYIGTEADSARKRDCRSSYRQPFSRKR